MYSSLATMANPDGLDESQYLFANAHDDFLSMPLSHNGVDLKGQASDTVPVSTFQNLHYSESTPSSVHYGDSHDMSEPGAGYMGGRDERDSSTSSAYLNGVEGSHDSAAPFDFPPLRMETITDASTDFRGVSIQDSKYSTRLENYSGVNAEPADAVSKSHSPKCQNKSMTRIEQAIDKASKAPKGPEKHDTHETGDTSPSKSASPMKGRFGDLRASSSIPATMSWPEYARQSILAAESSRLNPFALHPDEYKLLRHHINHAQVTIYLNIRNGILRLWTKNPLVYVSLEEAAGCARDRRYFGLAKSAYLWLLRNGYINFGCIESPNTAPTTSHKKTKPAPRRTVVVVGAGMSGLGCARQLHSLFAQLSSSWLGRGERPPRVIVLEARSRIGGRVYSHRFRDQTGSKLPKGLLSTAEMGAQIVTGFEHGNPLNAIIRGQLAIPYHGLRDNTILYDYDGTIVEKSRDLLVEKLYNDVLERASVYRHKPAPFRTLEGDRGLMLWGKEPSDNGAATVAEMEQSELPLPASVATVASTTEEKPSTGVEKLAGRAYQLSAGFKPNVSITQTVTEMGWQIKDTASGIHSLELDTVARSYKLPTLGQTMDEGIRQYQQILDLKPQDLRLLNWHHANLEYANATSVSQLSLSGWDQDIGNEFEGQHTEIIGGYQQVPRGLWQCPDKLDVRFKTVLKRVHYNVEEQRVGKAVKVECANGEVFEADHVVLTTPLGVLKSRSIAFEPPLPDWKQGVIERMGFGLLNKVILVYEKVFWEPHRDMFGLLNEAEHEASLDPKDYALRRGRYYLFWNCIKTSGKPTLIALMAGESAHYAEATSNDQLIGEVTGCLTKMFAPNHVPRPTEAIVTRWRRDPFACGSYSYVGPQTQAGDYEVMAKPCGPLHFAGEATCGTHPATVHGAYLSGLRAAAEVVEAMIGPIEIPSPLIEKKVRSEHSNSVSLPAQKRKTETEAAQSDLKNASWAHDEVYEASIIGEILARIGDRPAKPGRAGHNPFLLYTKERWYTCKDECDQKRRAATGDANARATRTEIRTALGLMWRMAGAKEKQPYLEQTQNVKEDAAGNGASFKERVAAWDEEAARIRREWIQQHPPPNAAATETGASKRPRRV